MAVRISVIIPVYNAAATLRDAVTSILQQNVDDLELLLVDDGSTDGTAFVCHELSALDPRVKVVTQRNAGICAARNRGLSVATGEYIAFCDDDDVFFFFFLKLLTKAADKTQADVVRGDYRLLRQQPDGTFREQVHPAGVVCSIERDGYGTFLQNSGPQFVWNALYRRTILQDLRFDERCRYGLEDFIFNLAVYAVTDRVVYLPKCVYCHYERAQSTSQCQSAQAMKARVRALEPWMAAEYQAVWNRCAPEQRVGVWNARKAEAVTFLMHQLRDAKAPGALRRYAWHTLRTVLAAYPGQKLDFLAGAGQNKKKTAALLLYQLRLQRLYDLLTVKQSIQ